MLVYVTTEEKSSLAVAQDTLQTPMSSLSLSLNPKDTLEIATLLSPHSAISRITLLFYPSYREQCGSPVSADMIMCF